MQHNVGARTVLATMLRVWKVGIVNMVEETETGLGLSRKKKNLPIPKQGGKHICIFGSWTRQVLARKEDLHTMGRWGWVTMAGRGAC
eukprot:4725041-Ditylum_brightwellii.AAC.1